MFHNTISITTTPSGNINITSTSVQMIWYNDFSSQCVFEYNLLGFEHVFLCLNQTVTPPLIAWRRTQSQQPTLPFVKGILLMNKFPKQLRNIPFIMKKNWVNLIYNTFEPHYWNCMHGFIYILQGNFLEYRWGLQHVESKPQ